MIKKLLTLLIAVTFTLISCESTKESTETVSLSEEEIDEPQISEGVVLWPSLAVRESGDDKGKYLTSIYQGEKIILLGESTVDSTSNKKNVYTKVALSDGTEGWVLEPFVAENAKSAAINTTTSVYKRPDLLTKSDKEFSKMDFVAVIDKSDDWIHVKGIPSGSTWFTEGWIKSDKVTTDAIDVSFAVLANRALQEKDDKKKSEELNTLLLNTDFQSSVFFENVSNILDQEVSQEEFDEEVILTNSKEVSDTTSTENF